MQKTQDGYFLVEGTLNSVSSGVVTNGQFNHVDYVEVDGTRWANVSCHGNGLHDALEKSVGKKVKLYFAKEKSRILIGFTSSDVSKMETMDLQLIKNGLTAAYMSAFMMSIMGMLVSGVICAWIAAAAGSFMPLFLIPLGALALIRLQFYVKNGPEYRIAKRFNLQYSNVK
ncbi:hypothetical protein LCL85_07055 [Vibrio alginolyticus]|nr:hypothetical protein [Vibrio alginolyticus]